LRWRRCVERQGPCRSEIGQALASGRTEELERLAIEMYARGLSVRDIERAFTDRSGQCVLSKSAASELSEGLWTDYQGFAGGDLSGHEVIYLFLDSIAERLHLRLPIAHRRAIRTTNLLERLFGEERRRTKSHSACFRGTRGVEAHARSAYPFEPDLASRDDQRIRAKTD
jgi:transposase-like protein